MMCAGANTGASRLTLDALGEVTGMAMNAGGRGIRLRPLDIGDVLDETFQVYRRSFVPLITTMAIVLVPASLVLLVASVVTGLGFGMGESLFDRLSPEAGMALIGAGIAAVFVIVVLAIASGL